MTQAFPVVGCLSSSYGRAARAIEHEQEYPASSQWKTAREGVEGHTCSQRLMVPWRHFQAMRPSVSRRGAKSARRAVLVDVPAASWECWDHRKGDQPQDWRATDPSTSELQPHNWSGRLYFLTFSMTSSSRKAGTILVFEVAGWSSSGIPRLP